MTALAPWHPRDKRTVWVDWRPELRLVDVLDLAERRHAERVMLAGPTPPRAWYLAGAPRWSHGGHYLHHLTPTGRYVHDVAGVTVEVRTCAEWFGAGDYAAADASTAWTQLGHVLAQHVPHASLFTTPGATGLNAWLLSRRRDRATGELVDPPQLDADTAELIRTTSPQHRIELLPAATDEPMPGAWYLDGRWMYAALCNELGTGPAEWMTAETCAAVWENPRGLYERARYLVDYAAPAGWSRVGLLMTRRDDDDRSAGWHAPLAGTTWADASEVHLALRHGWSVTPREGILLQPGRPLDTWATRLTRARDSVRDDTDGPEVAQLVRGAVRAILLQAIGAWHSSGRDTHTVTASPMTPPAGGGWEPPDQLPDGAGWLWRRHNRQTGRAAAMLHPEWSAQVWGRAHARILESPTGTPGVKAGALHVDPAHLVGIYGDALMLTTRPSWADNDDGRPGRLRVKGHACGPLSWPRRAAERDHLARLADAAGNPTGDHTC